MPGNLVDIPASVVATWPTPNYVDPPDQRRWLPIYSGVLQAVATVMVGTRLWLRLAQKAGNVGLDDALLVPAWLAGTMFTTLIILASTRWGAGRHIWDLPLQDYEPAIFGAWLSEIAFLISTCCTKVSVLLFYRRLVSGTVSRRWKIATQGAIVFTILYGLAFILVLCLNCRPTSAYWQSFSPTYTDTYYCADTKALNPVSGVLSCLSDLYSVLLPMGMLRHFDTDRRKKIALNLVFSLGFLVVGAGIARTYYLTKLGTDPDLTWTGFNVFVWSDLETQLALICASAPALRVFFRRYLSDPISKAMRSANSLGSGLRSGHRDSKQLPTSAHDVSYSHTRDSSDLSGMGDKNLIKHSVKPYLETVGEQEVMAEHSSPSSAPSENFVIKTPADFEAYALQTLERNRPTYHVQNHPGARPESEGRMHPNLSEPFSKWWLEANGKV